MTPGPTLQDFILHLRAHCPPLARRLDGIRGLERHGRTLRITAPEGSWHLEELRNWRGVLAGEAGRVFGPGYAVEFSPSPPDREALPQPVLASKVWNHIAFWARGRGATAVLAVRKPTYLGAWRDAASRGGDADALALAQADPEVERSRFSPAVDLPPGEDDALWALAPLLDLLAVRARAAGSYAHLVTSFPGDQEADRLEGRLAAIRDWGTPHTAAGVLQKFTGRLHYASPRELPLGCRLARKLLWEETGPAATWQS